MTEPTAEQIEAEREGAHELLGHVVANGCVSGIFPLTFDHGPRCTELATALARVRIEAHAAGRDEGLEAAEGQLRKQASVHESAAEMFQHYAEPQMIRANCLETAADAVRALRGRT